MSVEILTVSLSDESIERVSRRVAELLHGDRNQPTTQSNPPSSNPHSAQSAQVYDDDPWAGTNAAPPQQNPSAPQGQYQQQGPPPQQQSNAPHCKHGEMRFVPAGFSQSTGRSYRAFYGCTQPKGSPDKCRSVQVTQ